MAKYNTTITVISSHYPNSCQNFSMLHHKEKVTTMDDIKPYLTAQKFTNARSKYFSAISTAGVRRLTSSLQLNLPTFISTI